MHNTDDYLPKIRNMQTILKSLTVAAALLAGISAYGQSQGFKTGSALEIQNAIIKELVTRYVDSVKVDEILINGTKAALGQLDPYTMYVPEDEQESFEMMLSGSYGGIGAIIFKRKGEGVIINEPYYGSPAYDNSLVCGDMILEIDGQSVYDLETSQCSERMKGKPGTSVHFKVKKARTGDTVEMDITRRRIHLPDIEYSGMLDDSTGYIFLSGFTSGAAQSVRKEIKELKTQGMKRLVLDLRGNGGGAMNEAIDIVSAFVPKGTLVVSSKGRDKSQSKEYRTSIDPIDTNIPLMVMIDGASASSSEIVAGAIQDLDRGIIMGKRSFGKGLVQSVIPLPFNGQLKMTTARYYTPSGRCVQALDYSNRSKDGSASYVPDSLRHEFKTAKGRTVKDGGGITPDEEIDFNKYSRTVFSIVMNGIVDEYTIQYVCSHDSVPEDFRLSDEEFEDFVTFAAAKEFDYRSSSKATLDMLKDELVEDGLYDIASDAFEALRKAIDIEKTQIIRHQKDQIIPFIEEEIVTRYHYQRAGIKIRLRYDTQLHKALEKWNEITLSAK